MRWLLPLAAIVTGCSTAYYQACDDGSSCPSGYLCADPGADVCTTECTADADCAEHGAASFCALGGVCLSRCDADADCPVTAYCDPTGRVCLR